MNTEHLDPLAVRRRLGRHLWQPPVPHGPAGWLYRHRTDAGSVIATESEWDDGHVWIHASIAWAETDPTYADLQRLHHAVFGERRYAYQVFAPASSHISIHDHALHLWGRADGTPALPDFGRHGSI